MIRTTRKCQKVFILFFVFSFIASTPAVLSMNLLARLFKGMGTIENKYHEQVAPLTAHQLELEQKFAAMSEELNKKAASFEEKQAQWENKFKGLDAELKKMVAESNQHWLAGFRNKELLHRNITDHIAVGLYGEDLLKVSFIFLNYLLDYALHKALHNHYLDLVTTGILQNKEQFIALATHLSYDEVGRPLDDEAYHNFQSFLETTCFPPFTFSIGTIKSVITKLMGFLLCSEAIIYAEHQVLAPEHRGFWAMAQRNADWLEHLNNGDPLIIPISSLITPLAVHFFGATQSAAENVPILRTGLLRWTQCYHPFLSSYYFYLIKRLIIAGRFIKQSHNAYQQAWTKSTLTNLNELLQVMISNSTESDRSQQEKLLKSFFLSHEHESFRQWLLFKNNCCSWTDMELEFLILTPVWYKAIRWLLQN